MAYGVFISHSARDQKLAKAAEALLSDYITDDELIAFTALDNEDFHAKR